MPQALASEQTAQTDTRTQSSDGFAILHAYPDPATEVKWLECLAHSEAPQHFASPAFFLEPYFAEKSPFAILALDDGNVIAILTGLHNHKTVVSGLETRVHIAVDARRDPQKAIRRLVEGVELESRRAKLVQVYSWRQLSLDPFMQAGYRKREFTGNPVFDLSLGAEALIKRFGKSQRHNVRLAKKSGVEIVEATSREQFEEFYAIYEKWCGVKQTAQFSKAVEWDAFQNTRANRTYFLAMHEGKAIAGSVIRFYRGGLIECSRNSSLPEFRNLKPNDLLIAHTIEWGCAHGFQRISLGAHHKFLRGFGGEITPIDRYRADRTPLRHHDLKDFATDVASTVLHRLPQTWQQRIRWIVHGEKAAGW
jgi:hypothetical protein